MLETSPHNKKEIEIHGKKITYTLKLSKQARAIRLAIYHDGDFVVTSPQKISLRIVEEFIIKKSKWILEKIEHFIKNPRVVAMKHSPQEIQEYKKQAIMLVSLRLEYWNTFYNFTYKKITIKNTKSRWGSCSTQGNLNFNYKIVLLSQELSDYIIVHELCHLLEMNHSKSFWNLVAKTVPNHKELRKQLKVAVA